MDESLSVRWPRFNIEITERNVYEKLHALHKSDGSSFPEILLRCFRERYGTLASGFQEPVSTCLRPGLHLCSYHAQTMGFVSRWSALTRSHKHVRSSAALSA